MENTDKTLPFVGPDVGSDEQTFVLAEREGLQLDFQRNLLQLRAVLACVAIGALVGFFLTDDRPDLAALAGGVVGMVFGAFVSGFILMFLPAPAVTMTLGEIRRRYHRLERRLFTTQIAFCVCFLSLSLVIARFGHDDSTFAWGMCGLWFGTTIGLCAYIKMEAYRLCEWKCPRCSKKFGKRWSSCDHCGLALDPDRQ